MTSKHDLIHRSSSILADASKAGRDLTKAERAELDSINAQLDAINAEARRLVQPVGEPQRDDDFGAWLRGQGTGSTRTLAISAGERRFLATSPTGAGGALVPEDFVPELYRSVKLTSGALQAARIFTTPSGRDLRFPVVASNGTAASRAEGSAFPGVDPTFDEIEFKAYQFAQMIRSAFELVADSGVELEMFVAENIGQALDQSAGVKWTRGSGTAEPQGYVTGAGTAIIGGTATGAITYDAPIDLLHSLAPQHQAGAVFLASPSAVASLRKVADAERRPLWEPGLAEGAPDRLLGRPLIVDTHLDAVGPAGTSLACVNPQAFGIRIADGAASIERSADAFFAEGLIAWRGLIRTDSRVIDDTGVSVFVGGSA